MHSQFAASLIIVDEAHSIAENARGVLLQWVIDDLLERDSSAQILFASPNVRNLDIFGRLFGLADMTIFSSTEPTVAQNFLITNIETAATGQLRITSRSNCAKESSTLSINRPIESVVLKDWVTDTKLVPALSKVSMMREKSLSERVSRSIL